MQEIHLKDLLEAGCHFGHEVRRWHPKADSFIYSSRDNIHIIDLSKTREGLLQAGEYARQIGLQGKKLLFVGTKRQSKSIIKNEAERIGAPYFEKRWVGGFITNWSDIKKSIDKLNRMDEDKKNGSWQKFPKHEQLKLDRKRQQLEKFYGGVKHLKNTPDALFVVDVKKEGSAVSECLIYNIPIIGVVDTNSDPTKIDYPIPANDDAVKSITFLVTYIATAYGEGLEEFQKSPSAKSSEGQAKDLKEVKETIEVKKKRGRPKKKL